MAGPQLGTAGGYAPGLSRRDSEGSSARQSGSGSGTLWPRGPTKFPRWRRLRRLCPSLKPRVDRPKGSLSAQAVASKNTGGESLEPAQPPTAGSEIRPRWWRPGFARARLRDLSHARVAHALALRPHRGEKGQGPNKLPATLPPWAARDPANPEPRCGSIHTGWAMGGFASSLRSPGSAGLTLPRGRETASGRCRSG